GWGAGGGVSGGGGGGGGGWVGKLAGKEAPAVGPAGEDRALDAGRIHHRLEFVGPGFGILVAFGLERLVGIAVATQIVSHYVEVLGELAGDLLDPRQMALPKAVNENSLASGL